VPPHPDVDLVRSFAVELDRPIVAEGRYVTPDDVAAAFDAGATAVVVGTAITNPTEITRRLVQR
jgi:putative N-acetylmannosamine-6-phosphate epimerase